MVTRPFVLDMETSDPDDFLTLLLLLGHPEVDLVAVTVTPGTREQVGIVRQALAWFGRDVPVGAWDIDHAGNCVSDWHYKAYPQLRVAPADADCPGWEVLEHVLGPDTTLVCGAALKNLGALLSQMGARVDRDPAWVPPKLGRAFVQGGFAGEGVVPPERQLEKFRGKVTCPTYNLNGDPASALSLLQRRAWFSDLRFVSKNVCHGVKYDMAMHARFEADRPTWCSGHTVCDCECHQPGRVILHCAPCCDPCRTCGQRVTGFGQPTGRHALAKSLIFQGMAYYLSRHAGGKAFHDPLAACCAIDPEVGEWAEVELYRQRGEWGSYLLPGSGVRIVVGYDHERFVRTLLGSAE